jgi:hypothetical protein
MPMLGDKQRCVLRAAAFTALFSIPALAQTIMSGSGPGGVVRIFNTDSAVLESQDPRKDLPCAVTPVKPVLGFDMRFHAGFEVSVPLRELAGAEDLLTMIFRVTPLNRPEEATYFSHKYAVPAIDAEAKGEAYLHGSFDIGEGKYHVDWLMRDRSERVCSSYWDAEAALPSRDKDVNLSITPGEVRAAEREPFKEDPPIERNPADGPLNVKVLVNLAPQNSLSATMRPLDTNALVSILRSINREPRITKFSIVAFNMQEQRVVYRKDNVDRIDFPSLGEALSGLKLGVVDVKKLEDKNSETQFLSDLMSRELAGANAPDAVIFAGPKVMLDEKISEENLKPLAAIDYPIFYMNYILNPTANPWRDAIGAAVRYFKGAEFTISRPRDLFFAWTEIMSRIVKSKLGRHASTASR